ncbi:phosphohydrolase [Pseudoalteromonas phenolica]|uniref:Phosphohydrolase n=1 Tax=Pseudoalteromonas phenolica TaxID=161398 RepID=A0A4Q7IKY2_9GAMM|nr:HD domain-containing phosphohydrolase [Pseudoalteromonas phenolica]RZQ52844.1 phosphohydrolase [Pseudoalteromonas phenolica]
MEQTEIINSNSLSDDLGNELALQHLLRLAIELSSERCTEKLLENILQSAMELTGCDGGTIYSVLDQKYLEFSTLINRPLNLHLGGTSSKDINYAPISIFNEYNQPNNKALVAISAATRECICIDDVYACSQYDLTAAREMDKKTGYHTQSVLTIPLENHEDELNGVLQLINPKINGEVIPFSAHQISMLKSMGALAAVALTNRQLIDNMEELFQSLTRLIAKAIDEKSPYTGGHCRRVPILTMMIADAVHNYDEGPLKDFKMSDADKHELSVAGWLHDCGKIAIPESVMDKSTKLECVFDRIELLIHKVEIVKRDLEIKFLKALFEAQKQEDLLKQETLATEYNNEISYIESELAFLQKTNLGGEFMHESSKQRVNAFAEKYELMVNGIKAPILTENEIYNLNIDKGTLTKEERSIINKHMDITIAMLEALPFPKHLKRVPEFAGGHHEKMDGTGYPKGLTKEQMSVPARMMAIADIFEALSAADRPYKEGKPLSECLFIMAKMTQQSHLDFDLFTIFIKSGVYMLYAKQYMKPEQINEIDITSLPGFTNI